MIKIQGLHKSYYTGLAREKRVLQGVDLHVLNGGTQFLLGGNGAGKTTLLRTISTLLSFEKGSLSVNGHDVRVHALEVKQSIGFLSANTGLYERLTGREFLDYFALLYQLSPEVYDRRREEIIALFRLEECLATRCAAMSSGQKQRFNIARALLHDPPIYIMDEPTLGLDIESMGSILDFIAHAREQGKTLLIVTHNMDLVQKVRGRVAFLVGGVIKVNLEFEEMQKNSGQTNLIDAYRYYAHQ